MNDPNASVAPRDRTTTTGTYRLLICLGWLGLLTFLVGLVGFGWAADRVTGTVLQEIEGSIQCGSGALLAAVAFGLAEISWDVRNRLPERGRPKDGYGG